MFSDNKYKKWYDQIINRAKLRTLDSYTERHHIIPRCLGGTNDPRNLVRLTAREHFICHWLLPKFVVGVHFQKKLLNALGKFVQSSPLQHRVITSRQFEIAKKAISAAKQGAVFTLETREKIRVANTGKTPWNKGKRGAQSYPEEAKNKLSNLYRSRSFEERFGAERAQEIRQAISKNKEGKPSGMLGRSHSDETRQRMSERMLGKPQGPQKRVDRCPHCGGMEVTARHIKFCQIKQNQT